MKKYGSLVAAVVMCVSLAVPVYGDGFTDALEQVGRDAIQGYMGPGVTLLGAGANSGWYNSSKSYKLLMLPVGFSVVTFAMPLITVTDEMRTFDFSGELPMQSFIPPAELATIQAAATAAGQTLPSTIPFSADGVPTLFGSDEPKTVTYGELFADMDPLLQTAIFAGGINATDEVELPFVGLDFSGIAPSIPKVTMATVGVKAIPVVNNVQVGLSFLPTMKIPTFGEVGMLGLKLQHEVTPHIPVFADLPFIHLSAMYSINNFHLAAGEASMDFKNWMAQINGSVDAKLAVIGAGAYAGIGVEGSKMIFSVPMEQYGLPDIEDLEIKGDNKFRITLGGRISFAIFDIFADYNIGSTQIITAGITAVGLNGL